jgi:hypothetical protein
MFYGLSASPVLDWIKCLSWPELASRQSEIAVAGGTFVSAQVSGQERGRNPQIRPSSVSTLSEPIIVVSGLPRSGTSLMMQMLEAGGIPIATDGLRRADADNPRGYYELERVKSLERDASWLGSCKAKAVKIISLLLPSLPAQHEYRIIFMERRLPEILASQKKMLERKGPTDADDSDGELAASFERHLRSVKQELAGRAETKTLYVSYDTVLRSPREVAARIRQFLCLDLDLERMAKAVDETLYRNKLSTPLIPE